ncbi:zinc finger, CCHC-type containing protein [Tanacetum coccineum]
MLGIRIFRELLKLRIRGVNGSTSSQVQGTAKSSSSAGLRLFALDFQCPMSLVLLSDPRDGGDSLSLHLFTLREKSKRNRTPKDFGPEFQLYLIEGTRDEDVAFWKEAINDEMDSIMGNNTWVLADLPPGCKPLGCKWIFKRKLKVDGTIEKFKARLVIQGFKQKSGIDYFDTYAPVARISTIRLLIAMASIHNLIIHQMDVKTQISRMLALGTTSASFNVFSLTPAFLTVAMMGVTLAIVLIVSESDS